MKFIAIFLQFLATYFLMLSFMTFGFLQNKKMAEIFVENRNFDDIKTHFRIQHFGGIELSNFASTSHFMGFLGILISLTICFLILRNVGKKWIFIMIIFLTNVFVLYQKKFVKPTELLDCNPLNIGTVPNVLITGILLFSIATILFYASKKSLKYMKK